MRALGLLSATPSLTTTADRSTDAHWVVLSVNLIERCVSVEIPAADVAPV